MASRGGGAKPHRGRSGIPSARPRGLARTHRWRLRCPTAGDGSMGPRPKIATVERREGSRSHRDRSAPRLARASRLASATERKSAPVGAPPAPHQGPDRPLSSRRWAQARRSVSQAGGDAATSEGTKRQGKATTRTQICAAGTRSAARHKPRSGLFDIVKKDEGGRRPARPGTLMRRRGAGGPASWAAPASR